jgi:cytochrome c oxidase accessory protein FixG
MEMPKGLQSGARDDVAHAHLEHADVTAVNAPVMRELYAGRKKVYPKLASGFFRKLKWALMALTLGIYYVTPWIRWNRGPDLPSQAVILDMEHERFFAFGLEIWPQEFYYVTGLLILASLTLFLFTALAGRVWCGYFCPQTVWTDLMVTVERFWQGDRNARIRLDKEPWGPVKIFKKLMTHVTWLAIAVATGGAFVFYFADAPTLFKQLLTGTAPTTAYMFIGIFTLTTYVLGGIAREQVCIYMCPWPRIQGAMIDKESFLVSYRDYRGEPRGPIRKSDPNKKGDCIDCKACVAVCPMGIDIRDGAQLECIQCALCIDACNDIMTKISRPQNLIGYTTPAETEAEQTGASWKPRFVRTRTVLYFALMAVVGLIMLGALSMRTTLELNVLPERNPFYVRLSDGAIRNTYTIKILNKLHEKRSFTIRLDKMPAAARLATSDGKGGDKPEIDAPTDALAERKLFVVVPENALDKLSGDSHTFDLVVRDSLSGQETRRTTTFRRR